MEPLIIIPYIYPEEIKDLKTRLGYKLPVVYWEDAGRIGSDLAYQTLWNMYNDRDIIILHADMLPLPDDINNDWYYKLCAYAKQFPEAGMLGTTLLYPAKDNNNNYYIQHAGGQFINGEAIHFGGGLELHSSRASKELETDQGQYDGKIREVSWITFGGIYIRRSVIAAVGNFDPAYYWTYYRDVDYCITARSLGWKIYQTPIKLLHYEGRDNKRLQTADSTRLEKWNINHSIFTKKWANSDLVSSLDRLVYEEE
jgi:GT2 family glycosyltransferase